MAKKVTVKKNAPAPAKKNVAKPAAKPAKKPTPKPAPAKKVEKKPAPAVKLPPVVKTVSYWDVYSSALKRVARFPYDQRKEADAKAAKMKGVHFVQCVKEIVK